MRVQQNRGSRAVDSACAKAQEEPNAAALAAELGPRASAATVPEAIGAADVGVFAVWPDALKQLLTEYGGLLSGKGVPDPSNPVGFSADGTPFPTLPEGQSHGS